jgi:hypothetical protein
MKEILITIKNIDTYTFDSCFPRQFSAIYKNYLFNNDNFYRTIDVSIDYKLNL